MGDGRHGSQTDPRDPEETRPVDPPPREEAPTAPVVENTDGGGHTPLQGTGEGESRSIAAPDSELRSAAKTITSAAEALDDEERTRTRLLGLSGFGVNALGALALPLFGGEPLGQAVFLIGLAIHALSNFGLFYVAGRRELFTERSMMVLWCSSFVGLHLVLYYFGTLTVAAVALVLGLYIVGTTRFERVSLASFIFVSVGTAISAGLQIGGVIPEVAVVSMGSLTTAQSIAMLGLLEAMFVAVRFIGTQARQNLARALEQLSEATRAVAQREALLEEARAEYQRVQRVGGRGRFTDARVDRFELGMVLGRGGMGEIYEAIDTVDGSKAAVKVLTREAIHRENMLERFFRECEIVQRLRSPYVVDVLATGGPPDEVPFIAMERLVGRDLATLASEQRTLPMSEVTRMVREVGKGLHAAMDAGVVHRDIKPHNIFVLDHERGGVRYKILDFGVSKLSRGQGTLTEGQAIGTPSYMAPEQASGGRVDHVTDLYSLGAVAYRCLVGQSPFRGDDSAGVLLDVVQTMPTRPGALAPVHRDIDAVFAIALAKRPGDRFHRASEFADALEQAHEGKLPVMLRDKARRLVSAYPWPGQTDLDEAVVAH